jgi:hypothetical protein
MTLSPGYELSFDGFGRLILRDQILSSAGVNKYWGHEVAQNKQLRLDPNKVYSLLRDPAELAKAAPTFNNAQLLLQHDDDRITDDYPLAWNIGWIEGVTFVEPYLIGTIIVGRPDAIRTIELKHRTCWSCSYHYTADMRPGLWDGLQYFDGRMTCLRGRHVSLVKDGRVPEAVVDDTGVDYDAIFRIAHPPRRNLLPFQNM